ncbi:hypothetical protein ACFZCK_14555 [Kitasatospora purpeofusca]|uniref:hypothetical protein n=1 Tax=Kitasatospora purpeofusca TaxID=67352 RepID=UPI0036E9D851
MSAVVAGAAFGLATPSHAVERVAPAPTAHELALDATAAHPLPERANQGHY